MAWMDQISDIVSRYAGGAGGAAPATASPHEDYCSIANSAPPQVMADALSHAFRSDRTPDFPEMVSSLFRQSNLDQRTGLLGHLIEAAGPTSLTGLPVQNTLADTFGGRQSIAAEAANQVSGDQVRQMANQAQQNDPSIIDRVSGFYAQHPAAVKALGATAITIAIRRIIGQR
jgi:hypothetical protein